MEISIAEISREISVPPITSASLRPYRPGACFEASAARGFALWSRVLGARRTARGGEPGVEAGGPLFRIPDSTYLPVTLLSDTRFPAP